MNEARWPFISFVHKYVIISAVQHIRPVDDDEYDDSMGDTDSRRRRSISCEGESGGRRVRRSCVIIPTPPPKPTDPPRVVHFQVPDNLGFDGKFFFPNQTPNYNLSMFESSCLYWDENNETWTGEGCKVTIFSIFRKYVTLWLLLSNHPSSYIN